MEQEWIYTLQILGKKNHPSTDDCHILGSETMQQTKEWVSRYEFALKEARVGPPAITVLVILFCDSAHLIRSI